MKVSEITNVTWFKNLEDVQKWIEEEICENAKVLKAKWYVLEFEFPMKNREEENHPVVWLEIKNVQTAFKKEGCLIIDKDGTIIFRIDEEHQCHYWWFVINNPNWEFVKEVAEQ